MTSIDFHLRHSLRKKKSMGSLFVRVIHERVTRGVTLPYKIYPDEWDAESHCIILPPDDTHRFAKLKRIEAELEQVRFFLEDAVERLESEGKPFTSNDIIAIYRTSIDGDLFLNFTDKICNELIGVGQERTARAYQTVSRSLITFLDNKHLRLKQITPAILGNFEQDMRMKSLAMNTISFYMRNLRAIYNRAVREGLLPAFQENPFEHVYTGTQVTKKRALTKEDMVKLYALTSIPVRRGWAAEQYRLLNKTVHVEYFPLMNRRRNGHMPPPRIRFISDELKASLLLFLFAFHARGMSFVDMAYLRKENIHEGVIYYYRKKTGRLLEIRVTFEMEKIIRFFDRDVKGTPFVFPIIHKEGVPEALQYESALRVQNKRLKIIGEICGLNKVLSTHVARHTWATVAKGELLPLSVISEGLGHASERTTSIYLASFDRDVLDKASEKVTKAINSVE